HARRRGRGAVGLHRSDPRRLEIGQGAGGDLRGRELGAEGGRPAARADGGHVASPVAKESGGQVSATVSRVEAELAKIWAAPDAATGTAAAAKVRASTMNLVVIAPAADLERLREATDELANTHAGRVLLVTL